MIWQGWTQKTGGSGFDKLSWMFRQDFIYLKLMEICKFYDLEFYKKEKVFWKGFDKLSRIFRQDFYLPIISKNYDLAFYKKTSSCKMPGLSWCSAKILFT